MKNFISFAIAWLCVSLMGGCATGMKIDKSYSAKSQDSRVQFLILHFTAGGFPGSMKILTDGPVSSHYLVSDGNGEGILNGPANTEPIIYQLVDETQRAHHAGLSYWKGFTRLNASSIGIEIVNRGYRDTGQGREWVDFSKPQMDLVIELSKKIIKEHKIKPEFVLGHSDIAPGRKNDPGPKFPWKRFADEGLILWPNEKLVEQKKPEYERVLPDMAWFQRKLSEHGFAVPLDAPANDMVPDEQTKRVMSAFQAKYRQSNIDGLPDAETAALLDVITLPIEKPADAPAVK